MNKEFKLDELLGYIDEIVKVPELPIRLTQQAMNMLKDTRIIKLNTTMDKLPKHIVGARVGTYGTYLRNYNIILLSSLADLETLYHELGHRLFFSLYPNKSDFNLYITYIDAYINDWGAVYSACHNRTYYTSFIEFVAQAFALICTNTTRHKQSLSHFYNVLVSDNIVVDSYVKIYKPICTLDDAIRSTLLMHADINDIILDWLLANKNILILAEICVKFILDKQRLGNELVNRLIFMYNVRDYTPSMNELLSEVIYKRFYTQTNVLRWYYKTNSDVPSVNKMCEYIFKYGHTTDLLCGAYLLFIKGKSSISYTVDELITNHEVRDHILSLIYQKCITESDLINY